MRMLNPKNTVNKTSKSLLAKCMATEDIRVEHSNTAETASFDIKDRCLTLPVWKDMSNSMYDMLVAHEVSHALHTPFEEWQKSMEGVANARAFMQVANVVEDARIERLIKEQYAGVRKDFARAYSELHANDLFEIEGKDLSEMNLIDRLNIEFKLGLFGHVQVPFSADEQKIVTRMANTSTFTDVMELSKELFEDWKADQDEQDQESGEESGEGQDGESQDGQGQESGEANADDQDADDDGQEGDASGNESQDGQDGEEGDETSEDDSDGQDSSNGQESGEPNGSESLPSKTQQAFDQGLKDMVDGDAESQSYCTLPTSMDLDKIIFDFKDINDRWNSHNANYRDNQSSRAIELMEKAISESTTACDEFMTKSKSVVNHMVSQFQMKQSADADKRTSIAKTGVLDTTNMINYRWSEDIFLKNETVADAKNHGMVFFLDWSGSMGHVMKDTVQQLFILTEFCNKVNIPFEVYAFSDVSGLTDDRYPDDGRQWVAKENASGQLRPGHFTLINFLSSRMKKSDYKIATARLYHLAGNSGYGSYAPRGFGLGCTPLNEAILTAMDIVPRFQRATGVQIVNCVLLTDGQGSSLGARRSYYGKTIVHDPTTKRDYGVESDNNAETNCYLEILKDRTGCNLIGIFLTDTANVNRHRYGYINDNDLGEATATYKKSNFAIASDDATAYDECYIVRANIGNDDDALDALGDGASLAKIRNAFKKSANNTKTNKIIATKMIEVFASTLR